MQPGLDTHGDVSASDNDYQTMLSGVFACGDMRCGQSSVVLTIRESAQCAQAVEFYLSGASELARG